MASAIRAWPGEPVAGTLEPVELAYDLPLLEGTGSAWAWVPLSAEGSDRVPLVVWLHGAGGDGERDVHNPDLRDAAAHLGAILLAPTSHPECDWSVVRKADLAGSTEYIVKTIDAAEAGSKWAVGTEVHLVDRLAKRHEGVKTLRLLAGIQCLCTTMYQIDLRHLLWVLDELAEGRVVNQISVDPETKALARIALDRMLSLVGDGAAKSVQILD